MFHSLNVLIWFLPPHQNLSATQNQSLYEPLIAFLVRWRNHLRGKCPRDTSLKDFLDQAVHVSTIVTNGTVAVRRHHLLQIVDTSLLKCYLVTNSMRIGPLLRQENYCHLDEVEKILTEQKCLEVVPCLAFHQRQHGEKNFHALLSPCLRIW